MASTSAYIRALNDSLRTATSTMPAAVPVSALMTTSTPSNVNTNTLQSLLQSLTRLTGQHSQPISFAPIPQSSQPQVYAHSAPFAPQRSSVDSAQQSLALLNSLLGTLTQNDREAQLRAHVAQSVRSQRPPERAMQAAIAPSNALPTANTKRSLAALSDARSDEEIAKEKVNAAALKNAYSSIVNATLFDIRPTNTTHSAQDGSSMTQVLSRQTSIANAKLSSRLRSERTRDKSKGRAAAVKRRIPKRKFGERTPAQSTPTINTIPPTTVQTANMATNNNKRQKLHTDVTVSATTNVPMISSKPLLPSSRPIRRNNDVDDDDDDDDNEDDHVLLLANKPSNIKGAVAEKTNEKSLPLRPAAAKSSASSSTQARSSLLKNDATLTLTLDPSQSAAVSISLRQLFLSRLFRVCCQIHPNIFSIADTSAASAGNALLLAIEAAIYTQSAAQSALADLNADDDDDDDESGSRAAQVYERLSATALKQVESGSVADIIGVSLPSTQPRSARPKARSSAPLFPPKRAQKSLISVRDKVRQSKASAIRRTLH